VAARGGDECAVGAYGPQGVAGLAAARAKVSRVTLGSVERGEHAAGVLTYARLARTASVGLRERLDGAP
jgi:hypothetical protein